MRERNIIADTYLLEHFYGSCSENSKKSIRCTGVEGKAETISWLDVVLDGESKCGRCEFKTEKQGFYYGKGEFSKDFQNREYVCLSKIQSQEEFEKICENFSRELKGIRIHGRVSDLSLLERFVELEFVYLEGQRISHFWNMGCNPKLRAVTVFGNKYLTSLKGIEKAENLECIQFLTPTSSIHTVKIDSLAPLADLPNLREVVLSHISPLDNNIDHLIHMPKLEYLWVSPNVFLTECYAKFEAKRFMLGHAYGIYLEEGADIYPYGKGKRIMHTQAQKERYLGEYYELMEAYK